MGPRDPTSAPYHARVPRILAIADEIDRSLTVERLRQIALKTRTTKANVATALQMISWGLQVNDYGNAILDDAGRFIKLKDEGITENLWSEIVAYAESKGLKGGDYKKLNLPFENKINAQPKNIRDRMAKRVEDFTYNMLTQVFNAADTAPLVIEAIHEANTYDPDPRATRLENPAEWTPEKISEKAASLETDKGPAGDFDD